MTKSETLESHQLIPGSPAFYSFTKIQMQEAYDFKFGKDAVDISFDFQHYEYQLAGETELQFAERGFLWNLAEFTIHDNVRFVISGLVQNVNFLILQSYQFKISTKRNRRL